MIGLKFMMLLITKILLKHTSHIFSDITKRFRQYYRNETSTTGVYMRGLITRWETDEDINNKITKRFPRFREFSKPFTLSKFT